MSRPTGWTWQRRIVELERLVETLVARIETLEGRENPPRVSVAIDGMTTVPCGEIREMAPEVVRFGADVKKRG